MPNLDGLRARRARRGADGTDAQAADATLESEFSGLDALDRPVAAHPTTIGRVWRSLWPKLAAIAIAILAWQVIVWSGWKPEYALPGPGPVFGTLIREVSEEGLQQAILITLRRGLVGFLLACVIGVLLALAVVRFKTLRTAIGSLISGIQTMPSIAWFPLAILLFQLTEQAILFVVILGAAPSIANGLISGVDHIPRVLLRAATVMGARGTDYYRHVLLPAALPSFVAGLKQGWAFAWRSLMAGELLVIIAGQSSIGQRLIFSRDTSDAQGLLVMMIVILVIGIVIDAAFFGTIDRSVRRRWGLVEESA
ncbi:MAG TPA: ABC transporter permease [Candidatus Limnocylindrales bacterium]|jgi:NitT/TauT family transport system permease protein